MSKENLDLQKYLNGIISDAVDRIALSELYEIEIDDLKEMQRDIRKAWLKLDELGWDFEVMLKRKSITNGSES